MWLCYTGSAALTQRGLLENTMWLQVGSVTENRWCTCAAASLRCSHSLLWVHLCHQRILYKSGSFLLFRYRKNLDGGGAKGSSAIKCLLLILFENAIRQDEYCKHVCFVLITWRCNEIKGMKWNGRTWQNREDMMKMMMNKSPLSSYSNERGRIVIWEERKRGITVRRSDHTKPAHSSCSLSVSREP